MKTSELLNRYQITLKKSLGQNFLSNPDIAFKIVEKSDVKKDDTIIEIGTGAGVLTEEIAKKAQKVITFEIDLRLKPLLEERFKDYENVEIYFVNFLDFDLSKLRNYRNLKYIANIPYYISSPILEKIFFESPEFLYAILMFQKEFAERIMSKSGKNYSPLSIFVQTFCEVEKVLEISKSHFVPSPKVDSVILKLAPTDKYVKNITPQKFMKFIHICFSHRRKTLKNNLKGVNLKIEDLFDRINLNHMIRPEEVPIEKYIQLYKILEEKLVNDKI